ncbi:MAG: MFS transporter [Myxococcota bacterium]
MAAADATEARSSEEDAPSPVPHSVWTFSTYFAEGFPYNIVHKLAEIFFADMGASLSAIGLTSLFHLPLNLKFLWAAWADTYGSKRTWLIGAELALAVAVAGLAVVAGTEALGPVSVLFVVVALMMATHDIAIDGFYLEALGPRLQAKLVGLKAPSYRAALLVVGGPLLAGIGVLGWSFGFATCAVVLLALSLLHAFILPRVPQQKESFRRFWWGRPGLIVAGVALILGLLLARMLQGVEGMQLPAWLSARNLSLGLVTLILAGGFLGARFARQRFARSSSPFARGFVAFMAQPKVGHMLAFILLFRVGESFLEKMRFVFLLQHGMTKEFYGLAQGTVGMVAALVAPLLGGWLIARDGLRRWIWPFVLAQNVLNLLYAGLALAVEGTEVGLWTMGIVIIVEMFGAGLGTAVFMVFIMRCCMPEHRAAHMALLTSMMSVGWTVAGTVSGVIAESVGFAGYFFFTFLATLPGMFLIWGLPHLDAEADPPSPDAGRTAAGE